MNPKSLLERLEPGKVRGDPYVCDIKNQVLGRRIP